MIFSHSKICEFFYFKIAHLFIGVMLKTEIFDIYCMGKLVLGKLLFYCMGKLLLGKLVTGVVSVGEISDWGS